MNDEVICRDVNMRTIVVNVEVEIDDQISDKALEKMADEIANGDTRKALQRLNASITSHWIEKSGQW